LVVRNGVLIAERYYGPASETDLLPIKSVTKSVSSILLGIALARGKIKSLSETLGDLLPDMFAKAPTSAARTFTLAQVLTGTTGLVYEEKASSWWFRLPNPALFVGRHPTTPISTPDWSYNDAAIALLSPVLAQSMAVPLEQFARQALFSPLGIDQFVWDRDATGNATTYEGLKLRPRDLAKIAWTMADSGRWHGNQVIPADWVGASLNSHVSVTKDWRLGPMSDNGYGYLWFTGRLKRTPVAWAWGFGAQFAMVVPSLRLAVVTACSPTSVLDIRALNSAVMNLVVQTEELAA
jgi:CubicO group peptidase (beta-lactamase class C family)